MNAQKNIIKYCFTIICVIFYSTKLSSQTVTGINKNGKLTTNYSEQLNKNGSVKSSQLVNEYGKLFSKSTSNALSFNGTPDYLTLPSDVYFNGDFTIECWVYPTAFTNWSRIIDFGNGAGNNNVLLGYTVGTSGKPGLHVGGVQMQASSAIPLNQWSHVAGTLNGTTATIYINGVAAGSSTFPVPANVVRTLNYVGRSNWGTGDPDASAVFDDLRIWNVARTESEIQAKMFTELYGSETGLLVYLPFNEGVACGDNTAIITTKDEADAGGNSDATLHSFGLNSSCLSNFTNGNPQVQKVFGDGLTAASASISAYQIKQDYPFSTDGLYWISNPNINGGTPFQIYADMTTDGGGWTLIMCNTTYVGWNYTNAIALNTLSPSLNSNYSIIGWADYIKRSESGFQYMIDAQARGKFGGIWTANQAYSFTHPNNTQTDVTPSTRFGTWNYNDMGIESRMPWYSNCSGFITTSTDCSGGAWWGTLITAQSSWGTAPWINGDCGSDGCVGSPSIIWYWVR